VQVLHSVQGEASHHENLNYKLAEQGVAKT
jgi:hypothetical protein